MTQEDKELLLRDLSARLPYGLYTTVRDPEENDDFQSFEVLGIKEDLVWVKNIMIGVDHFDTIEVVKPYLRPMSSMTEEEMQDAREKFFEGSDHYDIDDIGEIYADTGQPYTSIYTLSFVRLFGYVDWLNAHHFDYRGLIGKGLAIEVTKENNPYES